MTRAASREATQALIRAGKSRSRSPATQRAADAGKRAPPGRGAHSRVIRIIGGSWRGRRFRFADVPDIRPTPDRVRETLFNWLGPRVGGARCLDLFAGSGALGLEALSRGAASVVLVEQNAAIAHALAALIAELRAHGARLQHEDALRFLARAAEPFDIVFLDPPFASGLLSRSAALLEHNGWLAPHALVYVECSAREPVPTLPQNWRALKAKRAGEVGYHLYARAARGAEPA
jgi:16S rRNA (guanine966-N2)-methyltransferase